MRRTKRAVSRTIALLLVCIFLAAPAAALYGESCQGGGIPVPDCGAAMVVELTTDSVLYASHENDRMYPASTTKLMTSLLAIEYVESGLGRLDDVIIFSDAAVNGIPRDTMHISISVGEKLTVEQVLYAMLLPSANEACLGMAEYVSGSIEAFVARMNERAAELGMKNTHYVTANGLHDDEHYTTAADMVLLMKEVLKHDVLRQISSTSTYVIPATNKYGARTLVNTNKCIVESSEYYNPDVVCGKTGFTTPAGNTLVTYSEVDGQQVVVVLLKAAQGITFSSTNRILGYLKENVSLQKVEDLISFTNSVLAADGTPIMAQPAVTFYALAHRGDDVNAYRKEYRMQENVTLPVYAGDLLGELALYDGDVRVATVNMVARANYGVAETTAPTESGTTDPTSSGETEDSTGSGTRATSRGTGGESTSSAADPEEKYNSVGRMLVRVLVIALIAVVACVVIYAAILGISILRTNARNKKRRAKLAAARRENGEDRYDGRD